MPLEVKSSTIHTLDHDPDSQVCTVAFHGGKRYTYQPMTVEEYSAFSSAPSVGAHFAAHVRNNPRYAVSQLPADDEQEAVPA